MLCRLNKIGKNPHLVSNRETLDSDCKTMNAIVNALSGGSDPGSLESLPHPSTPRLQDNLRDLGKMLARANLPRAVSHGNMFVNDTHQETPTSPKRKDASQPPFHRSDIFLEKSPKDSDPPADIGTLQESKHSVGSRPVSSPTASEVKFDGVNPSCRPSISNITIPPTTVVSNTLKVNSNTGGPSAPPLEEHHHHPPMVVVTKW